MMPRADAFPEQVNYRDTGCSVHPSCLSCPLPRCVLDAGRPGRPWADRVAANTERALEMRSAGMSTRRIAEVLGVSQRVAQRYVAGGASITRKIALTER